MQSVSLTVKLTHSLYESHNETVSMAMSYSYNEYWVPNLVKPT